MFQERTVFVFTKSWLRDQLMQKAYTPYSQMADTREKTGA